MQFDHFYTHAEIMEFVDGLAAARPDLCRLSSLGISREGRHIPLLVLTDQSSAEPDDRPGYLIFAGIHAHEPAATHAPLYLARKFLDEKPEILREVTFYIVPRLTVDGSEFTVSTSSRIRSRTDRHDKEPNALYQEDMDGNGLILTMRQEHPDGRWVTDPQDTRLLIRRKADSSPPYYRTFPEGRIHDWDGSDRIKTAGLHAWAGNQNAGGRSFDWNRNWAWNWKPEDEQQGAGDFPFSEKEVRYLAELMHRQRNLFGATSFHCGYSAILRAPSAEGEAKLNEADEQITQEIAQIGSDETGFPVLSPLQMHRADQRSKPKWGHFLDFSYHHLGLFAFEIELGTVMDAAGVSTADLLAAKGEEQEEEWMRRLMKWWDRQERRQPLFEDWTPFQHPQLGRVEVGGFLYSYLDNPALCRLEETLEGACRFTLRHAEMHPRVQVEGLRVDRVGEKVYRIRVRVANRGRLPTHISNRGKSLPRIPLVRVDFRTSQGVELLSREARRELGHLPGITGSRELEWFLSAPSQIRELCEIHVLGGTGGNIRTIVRAKRQAEG